MKIENSAAKCVIRWTEIRRMEGRSALKAKTMSVEGAKNYFYIIIFLEQQQHYFQKIT